MNMPRISRLEREILQLPSDEQRWLVDRLARRIRTDNVRPAESEGNLLANMAADPEIVRELRTIDEDFRVTENDGLGNS